MARDLLEVEPKHVCHKLREHGVGRHEQSPEHHNQRRGDHEAARDGRGTAPSAATAGLGTRSGSRRIHERKRRGGPRVQRAQRQRAHVSEHARATYRGRGETMSREREAQRGAAKREQLQRRSVAPCESGRERDADHQPDGTLAIHCESRVAVQRDGGDCDRRDPQRQVQTRRAWSAQQRIARSAENHARQEQGPDGSGWHGIEPGRRVMIHTLRRHRPPSPITRTDTSRAFGPSSSTRNTRCHRPR